MGRPKKLQVFLSSTYTDLKEDRQAAVEGILTAGHIPAGMELFTAGDQTQMEVIRQWIGESDVFLLILGGRFGSIEPTSQKSYIQLEYEYALECGKALFAVVIAEDYLEKRVRKIGSSVIETDHPSELKVFRAQVLSRLVRFWSDPRDIKLSVIETLSQFARRPELVGWVPGDEASNTTTFVDEIARLSKENARLRDQVSETGSSARIYKGLSFDEMFNLLLSEKIPYGEMRDVHHFVISTARALGHTDNTLLDAIWWLGERLSLGLDLTDGCSRHKLCQRLSGFGLVRVDQSIRQIRCSFTDDGRMLYLRMKVKCGSKETRESIDRSND